MAMALDVATALKAKLADLMDDAYGVGPGVNADQKDMNGTLTRLLATCKGTHGWEATGSVDLNTALWLKIPHT